MVPTSRKSRKSRKIASRKIASRSRKSVSRKIASRKVASRKSVSRVRKSRLNMSSRKTVDRRILPKSNLANARNSLCNSLGEEECKRLSKRKTFPCRWVPAKGNRSAYCGMAIKEVTMGEGYRKKK